MSHTLQEAAQITGQSYMVIKKHAQRGKLKTYKDGRTVMVSDEDLALYQAAEGLEKAASAVRASAFSENGQVKALQEAGNVISRLPPHLLTAILDGIPRTGKGGHAGRSEPFKQASETVPHNSPIEEPDEDVDPHGGKPIGFQWSETPRWKRTSESTWAIGRATWTWNGLGWESGGSIVGRTLEDGVSPANPYSSKRPLAPSKKTTDEG